MILVGIIGIISIIIILMSLGLFNFDPKEKNNNMSLKKAYLYLVSIISLVIFVIGTIILINLALKAWVFTKADYNYFTPTCVSQDKGSQTCSKEEEEKQLQEHKENRRAQKQNDAAQAIAMIIVSAPVWYFHWKMAKKEV